MLLELRSHESEVPFGPLEGLLAGVRAATYARDESGGQEAGYGLETEAAQLDGSFVERAQAAQTLREIDEAMTAPLHGFASADDYYARSSSRRYLPGIQVPALILRAKDDPLIPASDIPYDLFEYNPALFAGITERGGHVGWVEGWPLAYHMWAQRQAAAFLASYLRSA
jgi:predicted alpha/beta-fold hydrolase